MTLKMQKSIEGQNYLLQRVSLTAKRTTNKGMITVKL